MAKTETVQLFITCLVDSFFPHVGESLVHVLNRAGVRVEFPAGQTCCGQPAFNAGLHSQARPLAEHTIQVLEKTTGEIIIPSGSCAAMVKYGYLELFKQDPNWLSRSEKLASRVHEFTEYLVDVRGISDLGSRWPGKLTYHPSCHLLRLLGVDRQPRLLLDSVRDAEIIELPERSDCCGFGGVFSIEHPELSAEFLKRKISNLDKTGSPTLVVGDTGCLMHIQGGLHRLQKGQRVVHIAEGLGYTMSAQNFRQRIRQSIADDNLQIALDGNAQNRTLGRLQAFSSIPDYQERRGRLHAIKEDVVFHLDEYLGQFIERVTQNGIQIHRAADAQEAIQIFLEIAREKDAHLVAKSKSMLSEEINFNHALELAGIHVVETDLGEYIVQLRGERPSHILTPAVHLRRGQVGQLFHEKLGTPYTEDIPEMVATARRVLREVFLKAEIGVSGVNFGVVETGTLCMVTNEGNGRMVTSLPAVHVALMGIERLVPTLADLALFLSMLPRSATGQKLSVYTSLLHSPKKPADVDGPLERHLILVDNGRSKLQTSPLAEALYCIRCGACLNACPVFREISGLAYLGRDGSIAPYPGPIGSVLSPGLLGCENFGQLAQASSLCGACKEACPVDINLPELLLRVRAGECDGEAKDKKRDEGIGIPPSLKFGLQAYRLAAETPWLFSLGQRLAGLFSHVFSPHKNYMHMPAWTGWGYSKEFPRLALRSFRSRWKGIKQDVNLDDQGFRQASEQDKTEPAPVHSLANQFTDELAAIGVKVYRLSEDECKAKLARFLQERGIERVCVDLVGEKYISGIPYVCEPDPTILAGVTGALVGIADTGSLLLVGGEGRPLTASLLPDIHIAILRESDLVSTLAEAISKPEVQSASAAVVITGPSRTADIEMALTIGVHGPKELHVFLIG